MARDLRGGAAHLLQVDTRTEEVVHKKDGNEKFADAMLDKYFKPIPGHSWFFEGMDKDQIAKMRAAFEQRYGKVR